MKQALLLIDIQNDYFENGKMDLVGSDLASKNARMVLDWFRQNELPVIHIKHIAIRPDAAFFAPNTPGAEINGMVQPLEAEKLIVKHFPNSFRGTDLLKYLKLKEIKQLVVCGMMTHMCVDSTVRAAKDLGFNCKVIGDACATRDLIIEGNVVSADEVQKSFLAALNYFYSEIVGTLQFLKEGN